MTVAFECRFLNLKVYLTLMILLIGNIILKGYFSLKGIMMERSIIWLFFNSKNMLFYGGRMLRSKETKMIRRRFICGKN